MNKEVCQNSPGTIQSAMLVVDDPSEISKSLELSVLKRSTSRARYIVFTVALRTIDALFNDGRRIN